MELTMMEVSAWSNGRPNHQTGAGLGIRISIRDRSDYFCWKVHKVKVLLDGQSCDVKLTGGFWKSCPELRDPRIGQWLIKRRLNRY